MTILDKINELKERVLELPRSSEQNQMLLLIELIRIVYDIEIRLQKLEDKS